MRQNKPPLIMFFVLTFTFTWALCGYLLMTTPPDVLQNISPKFLIVAISCGLSPTLVALFLSVINKTQSALTGQLIVRCPKSIFVPALLIAPILGILSYLPGHTFSPATPIPIIAMGLVWPLFSSFGEEFGWRGFAFSNLYGLMGFLRASTLVGLLWGLWHLPMDYIGLRSHGWLFIPEFLLVGPGLLTAHAIIMSYLSRKGNNSLWPAIIYHYSITASAILLPSIFPTTGGAVQTGLPLLLQPALITALAWGVALVVILTGDKTIIRGREAV